MARSVPKYKSFKTEVRVLDYRPHTEHGPPLVLLADAFREFSEEASGGLPDCHACMLAKKLVELVSQVGRAEGRGGYSVWVGVCGGGS